MKYGTHEWYLYHNKKNEDPIIPLIVLSGFLILCKGGIGLVIVTWFCYYLWAKRNNEELNNDPEVLRARQAINELRRQGKIE